MKLFELSIDDSYGTAILSQPRGNGTDDMVELSTDMIPLVIAELQRIYDSKNKKNDGQPIPR